MSSVVYDVRLPGEQVLEVRHVLDFPAKVDIEIKVKVAEPLGSNEIKPRHDATVRQLEKQHGAR
ncbi:hypothetical protein DICSQDRAFT_139606 [Dichomitus squalens LYAD-421 SS1]|uniref:Uncharacterized protein n=1 Tax=Dichomitus squalens (strain LYAD-421) TaxID=732165 RepID=R7SPL0_DICSQ|nr:uncharacterized protein DICSQDRAFT_139606 [Dichomitus squalens LYAD-421 SS1]EJF58114.1 hypothetical protein DICSQDRAFT_139606 [Dichomitus squalens LYAD-421 SS1]